MRMLIMGAPGSGKGTQSVGIAEHYGVPAISTGDIFRTHIKNQTELGKQVAEIVQSGNYVPDELTEALVAERLNREDVAQGFLLDGFPRTAHQVEALDEILAEQGHALDAVISLEVTPELLLFRLNRRATIEGRADDNEETIRHRMSVYEKDTRELLEHYREKGLLVAVDANGTVDEVNERIFAALEHHSARA